MNGQVRDLRSVDAMDNFWLKLAVWVTYEEFRTFLLLWASWREARQYGVNSRVVEQGVVARSRVQAVRIWVRRTDANRVYLLDSDIEPLSDIRILRL